MNLEKPCLCPECGEPMQVLMPVWIRPGYDTARYQQSLTVHQSSVDWDSSNRQSGDCWYCESCDAHHLPAPNDVDS